jgi:hypothetical protein
VAGADPGYEPEALIPAAWLERNPDRIPTMAIIVFESIDGDGDIGFHIAISYHCQDWRQIGLLRSALVHVEAEWAKAFDERTDDD